MRKWLNQMFRTVVAFLLAATVFPTQCAKSVCEGVSVPWRIWVQMTVQMDHSFLLHTQGCAKELVGIKDGDSVTLISSKREQDDGL